MYEQLSVACGVVLRISTATAESTYNYESHLLIPAIDALFPVGGWPLSGSAAANPFSSSATALPCMHVA